MSNASFKDKMKLKNQKLAENKDAIDDLFNPEIGADSKTESKPKSKPKYKPKERPDSGMERAIRKYIDEITRDKIDDRAVRTTIHIENSLSESLNEICYKRKGLKTNIFNEILREALKDGSIYRIAEEWDRVQKNKRNYDKAFYDKILKLIDLEEIEEEEIEEEVENKGEE